MMSGNGSMWFGGGFIWIFWILLIVALVWGVKAATNGGNSSSGNAKADESPLEILKKRYAKGEIEEDEYIRKRNELEKK